MDVQRTPVPDHLRNQGPLATEKQVSYLEALRDGKDLSSLSPEQIAWLRDADFSKIPKHRASDVIEQLKDLDWAPKDTVKVSGVPDGRYAIYKTAQQIAGDEAHSPGADSKLMFYSVKKGKHVTFVDVWASDTRWPVKNPTEKARILNAIKNDPDAGPRFGREIGACWVCGRTLTDELSRKLGIGPVCRDNQ
jgi:hypothetical protein